MTLHNGISASLKGVMMTKPTAAVIDEAEQVLLALQVREREERKRLALWRLGQAVHNGAD